MVSAQYHFPQRKADTKQQTVRMLPLWQNIPGRNCYRIAMKAKMKTRLHYAHFA